MCELVIKSVCAVKSCTGGKGGGTEGREGGGGGSGGPDFYQALTPPPARGGGCSLRLTHLFLFSLAESFVSEEKKWWCLSESGLKPRYPELQSNTVFFVVFFFLPVKQARLVLFPSSVSACLCLHQLF